jgi:glucose-6-phosphate isomerase
MENSVNCIFENDRVTFKSFINEFTSELYKEFDLKAEKIGLESKIDDLFNGKKVNHTEGLAAWHPKYRDEYIPDEYNTSLGYKKENELWHMCHGAKNIITIGIGGSFEGPKMLLEFLSPQDQNFIFITGSDPSEFRVKTTRLNPEDTIFFVSSKSFTTEETIATLKDAISWSGAMNRFIAITANKGEAEKYNIKNIIEFDQEIGGRYSIWSDISVIFKWFSPEDFDDFMAGGKQADIDLKKDDAYLKFVKTLAYSDIWLHNFKNKKSRAVLSYIWNWRSFPDYVQQLEMESLGKQPSKDSEFKKTGQIIFGGYGPRAQHSYFQLLHQGTQDICVDIIADSYSSKVNPETLAYAQAITQSKLLSNGAKDLLKAEERINANMPTNLFLINCAGSYELGYLIATWEHRTYITAVMLGINPFDQFGVSAGKIYTKKYLRENGA